MTRDKDFQPFEIELQPGYLSVSNFSSLSSISIKSLPVA